jgi:PTH1 family peptidyl-tRNA hydrolase
LSLAGREVTLLKPAASMNLTGPLVRRYLELTGQAAGDCVIVHDDIDLELGAAKGKQDGGDGGHRGVRSVIDALGTDRISRVRIGVRHPGDARKARDVVLAAFSPAERQSLDAGLRKAEALILAAARAYSAPLATKGSATSVR